MKHYMDESNQYIMNTYGRFEIEIQKGEGCYLYDQNDKGYLDLCAGIAVNTLGYNHARLSQELKSQIEHIMHTSNYYYTRPQVEAAKLLVEHSPFDKVFFCNSGTEANEAAIKLARKHGKSIDQEKYQIISMHNSFHGRSYGSLSATGQEKYQSAFTPIVPGFDYAKFNDIESLKGVVSHKTCAVILEVIQGEGGVQVADYHYMKQVRKLCDEHQALLIIDEVQTGMGRCGSLFAFSQFSIVPDVVTLAKGLGGGLPIGAMLCKEEFAVLGRGDHGTTFGGNPLVTTAAKVVLEELIKKDLIAQVQLVGAYLENQLSMLEVECPMIKEVRGKGLMQGIELKCPAQPIIAKCLEEGMLVVGAGEYVIRLLPPLIITIPEIDKAIQILEKVMGEV